MPEAQASRRIKIQRDGPYVVTGGVPLVAREPVETERGEPIAWSTGRELDRGDAYALCRCGGSASKPYCDGTHARKGFDGTEVVDDRPIDDRRKDYEGTGIVVHDDRSICTHAGFCGNRITNVWKMVADSADTQVRSNIAAMVERCPSGALSYSLGGEPVEPALAPAIAVTPDGPLWVTGGIPVEPSTGVALAPRNRVTLCRCGASKTKPLCDGSHKDVGFEHRL